MNTLIRLLKVLGIMWLLPWFFLGAIVLLCLTAVIVQKY